MAKASVKAPHVTRAEIEEYLSLEERRKSLSRQAEALKKEAAPIVQRLMEFVRRSGGKERSVVRSGHILAIEMKAGSVQWKPEFVRVAGQQAAEDLIAAAEPREALRVEIAA